MHVLGNNDCGTVSTATDISMSHEKSWKYKHNISKQFKKKSHLLLAKLGGNIGLQ